MFKITVTTTATSLWDLLTESQRTLLLSKMNFRGGNLDNIYIQNEGTLFIRLSEGIIPTQTTGVILNGGNENTYFVQDLKSFYLISEGTNTSVSISGL